MSEANKDWENLFQSQLPNALRLAVKLTGNVHDAEDILQESLLRAAWARETFRGECTFRTWLNRIIVNVFRTWVTSKPSVETLLEEPMAPSDTTDEKNEQQARSELIAQHVSRLPERQREVLVFVTYEQMSPQDVAELFGLTIQNVYSNLTAARQQLRKTLGTLMKTGVDQ
jgi:RNA polymerase sigma-70 factor (ECF subfamily)